MKKQCIGLIVLFLFPWNAYADLYMWVDEKGVKHYSNVESPADMKVEVRKQDEIQFDAEKAAQIEVARKERESVEAEEKSLVEETIEKARRAEEELVERREAKAKISALEEKVKKVENDLEKEKADNDTDSRRVRVIVRKAMPHDRNLDCKDKRPHCEDRKKDKRKEPVIPKLVPTNPKPLTIQTASFKEKNAVIEAKPDAVKEKTSGAVTVKKKGAGKQDSTFKDTP